MPIFSDLHWACCRGCGDDVIDFLCDIEGIEEKTSNGDTPLLLAAYHDHEHIVEHLLRLGANVNVCNEDGMTALMIACINDNQQMITLILECSRTNLNAKTVHGNSALLLSCYFGCKKAVNMLLMAGADPYIRNNSNVNAFEAATHNNHHQILDMLFEYSFGSSNKC